MEVFHTAEAARQITCLAGGCCSVPYCRSSAWGLFTTRTLMVQGSPAELPPPAPAQAEALSATDRAPAANEATRIFARVRASLVLQGVAMLP
ncbi:hypothetical protein AHiyo6_16130, partial [Arthrobacter sp. Hiyo6]